MSPVSIEMQRKKLHIPGWCLALHVVLAFLPGESLQASAHTTLKSSRHNKISQTGVRRLTPFEKNLDQLRMNALFLDDKNTTTQERPLVNNCSELCQQCIEIPVYFHLSGFPLDRNDNASEWVIPHPTNEFRLLREELANVSGDRLNASLPVIAPGRFSNITEIYKLIQDNMDVLNRRYRKTPFSFRWVNSDLTAANSAARVAVNDENVFFYAGDLYQSNDFATAVHAGDSKTLNVYLVYRICGHSFIWVDSNCVTIGAATNPSYQLDNTADGVYLSYDTLTGGG